MYIKTFYSQMLIWLYLIIACILISGCRSTKYIEGTVVDFYTSEPIQDVNVTIYQRGWDLSQGLWDKDYVFQDITNEAGHFQIQYDVGSSANIVAYREGYIPYENYHAPNSQILVKLKKIDDDIKLEQGILEIGIENGKFYGWRFSDRSITFDPDEADIFPIFDDRERLILTTSGQGGIVFRSSSELGFVEGIGRINLLIYTDYAPENGYRENQVFDFNTQEGIFFIRLQNGKTYAKIAVSPSSYNSTDSLILLLPYVYNPEGSYNLRYQQ